MTSTRLSRAMAESYASGDAEGVTLTAASLDHPSFAAPIYVVAGIDAPADDPGGTIPLPIEEGGEAVPHVPCAFTFIRPGTDHDGPTDGKVQIDNVSALLQGPLKGAVGYNEPIDVVFRQYRILPGRLDAVTGPDEVIDGLLLSTVDLRADALTYEAGRQQNVPTGDDAFFDRTSYPGLFA
jgi:hypothetical protein